MEWTTDDKDRLVSFSESIDSDNIKIKEQIKKVLLGNRYICHVLNNSELESDEDTEVSDYYGVNILPYYILPDAQTDVENYICFEVSGAESSTYSGKAIKVLDITFYILCKHHNMIDGDTGIARHDLLAALIQDQFNNTTYFGSKIRLISDKPSTTNSAYATRTLIFEQITDNNLVKSNHIKDTATAVERKPRLANKEVQPHAEIS